MGDFVGGMLKYLRKHPVPNIVIGGGFAKVCKLAQGNLDLHSGRSQVDLPWLAKVAEGLGADNATRSAIRRANTAAAALSIEKVDLPLANDVAQLASGVAQDTVGDTGSNFRVLIF